MRVPGGVRVALIARISFGRSSGSKYERRRTRAIGLRRLPTSAPPPPPGAQPRGSIDLFLASPKRHRETLLVNVPRHARVGDRVRQLAREGLPDDLAEHQRRLRRHLLRRLGWTAVPRRNRVEPPDLGHRDRGCVLQVDEQGAAPGRRVRPELAVPVRRTGVENPKARGRGTRAARRRVQVRTPREHLRRLPEQRAFGSSAATVRLLACP
jgi:hypothetical protein